MLSAMTAAERSAHRRIMSIPTPPPPDWLRPIDRMVLLISSLGAPHITDRWSLDGEAAGLTLITSRQGETALRRMPRKRRRSSYFYASTASRLIGFLWATWAGYSRTAPGTRRALSGFMRRRGPTRLTTETARSRKRPATPEPVATAATYSPPGKLGGFAYLGETKGPASKSAQAAGRNAGGLEAEAVTAMPTVALNPAQAYST